jgi:2,5-diketocamphane 1,2-monooxygenase
MAERAGGGWGQLVADSHDNLDNPQPYFELLQRLDQEVAPSNSF